MTVHLAGSTPADELNGLPAIADELLDGHLRGDKHLVLGVVKVTGTKSAEKTGFEVEPIVSFTQIETVPDELREQVLDLLHKLRSARSGKTTLDFPTEEPAPAAPLELTGLDDAGYRFEVKDAAPGSFDLAVRAASGALVDERFHLPRVFYGEIPPGEYQLVHLENEELQGLAQAMVREYEAGFVAEDVVEAEVVEDPGFVGEFDGTDEEED